MKNINEDMLASIKKHLPEMAAGELKQFIEDAQEAMKERDQLKIDLENKQEMAEKLVRENQKLTSREKEVTAIHNANEVKAKELEQQEIRQEVEMLKFKNQQLEIRVKDSKDFMMMLAKNPRALEYMSYSAFESIPMPNNYGGVDYNTKTKSVDTVTEKVETKEPTTTPINTPNN